MRRLRTDNRDNVLPFSIPSVCCRCSDEEEVLTSVRSWLANQKKILTCFQTKRSTRVHTALIALRKQPFSRVLSWGEVATRLSGQE